MYISVISVTRRPEKYLQMINEVESKMGDLVLEYIAFVNDRTLFEKYRQIKADNSKVKLLLCPENYIFQNGHDKVYNVLGAAAKGKQILILFDSDSIEVQFDLFRQDILHNQDLYVFDMYMQRGDVWEKKMQLYKNNGNLQWYGLVHENQTFTKKHPNPYEICSFKVLHNNAIDNSSLNLKKTNNGFIILEKTEEGTDSDNRNLLYESLAYKIVNQNGRHLNRGWFIEHYKINKEVIDWYYERASKKWS
jgi:hypothetical protein